MSRLLFTIVFFCSFLRISAQQNAFVLYTDLETEREQEQFAKAKVKKQNLTISEYKLKLEDFEKEGRLADIKLYDEHGRLTEKTSYFANASKRDRYIYNEDGQQVQIENYFPAEVLTKKIVNAYNAEGQIIQSTEFNKSKRLVQTSSFIYEGNKRTETAVDTNGKQKAKTVFIVGETALLEEHLFYGFSEAPYKEDYIEYNGSDQRVKWISVDNSFRQYKVTEYEYDEKGNVIKERVLDAENRLKRYREFTYNDKGLITESVEYDKEGNPRTKWAYTYDYY